MYSTLRDFLQPSCPNLTNFTQQTNDQTPLPSIVLESTSHAAPVKNPIQRNGKRTIILIPDT